MAPFNKVKQMKDAQVQAWLRKVGYENVAKLGIAMLGADGDVRNLIYKNMSPRAGRLLQEDLEKYQKLSIEEKIISDYASELEKLM